MSESNDKSINKVLDESIKSLTEQTVSVQASEALHLSQAALNLSHVKTVLASLP